MTPCAPELAAAGAGDVEFQLQAERARPVEGEGSSERVDPPNGRWSCWVMTLTNEERIQEALKLKSLLELHDCVVTRALHMPESVTKGGVEAALAELIKYQAARVVAK